MDVDTLCTLKNTASCPSAGSFHPVCYQPPCPWGGSCLGNHGRLEPHGGLLTPPRPCTCPQVMLEQMQGVVRLELSGCNDFTEAGLWSSLSARITSLSVSDCINVADDAIAAISQLLPNLAELSLQAYHVTDTALAYFTARQGHSTHTLRLLSCWEITNHGVVNVVHSLPNLTALSLSGCSKVTDDGVELVAENLRKLRSLDLSWCPRITDMALEYVACDLHRLEELVLDRCARPHP